MCCILDFIKWSINCLQRSVTCVLGFWVIITIVYALALGISAGVAFGYDYALAEYKTLARPDAKLKVKPYVPFPVNLFRRRITSRDNEIMPRNEALQEESDEVTRPTLWLYEPSQRYTQRSRSIPVTEIMKMSYKTTKERKKLPPDQEENERLLKVMPLIYTSTTRKPDSTLPKSDLTSEKPILTSPKLDSTFLKSDSITPEMTTKKLTTSLWPSSSMRIFKPKSMFFKWRPTKPNKNFFYRTLAASHRSKNLGQSYDPEMEIRTYRTLVHGKYEGLPIRVWNATTRATEPIETSEDDNTYRNIIYF